jgi:hypothetical protein
MRAALRRLGDSWLAHRVLEVLDRRTENRMTEYGMLAQAFEFARINQVAGDYFEFGLWRGKTFLYAHKMKRRYRLPDVVLRGFDSFEGLPAHERSKDGIWSAGQFACSEEEFRGIIRRAGVRDDEYRLVKGFYQDSLNAELDARMQGVKAAVVYIDCDLYESTLSVLDFVAKYLVNGSVVCFDDYYNNRGDPRQGEQRALAEFLARNGRLTFVPYFDYSPLGKSFIVRTE